MTEPAPRVRVAGIWRRGDDVLLVCHEKAGRRYWMLPGGGVDHGETLQEALVREWREECQLVVTPGPLRAVFEAIDPSRARHVITLAFDLAAAAGTPVLGEDPRIVDVAWHPISALPGLALRPPNGTALATLLQSPPPAQPIYLGNRWTP